VIDDRCGNHNHWSSGEKIINGRKENYAPISTLFSLHGCVYSAALLSDDSGRGGIVHVFFVPCTLTPNFATCTLTCTLLTKKRRYHVKMFVLNGAEKSRLVPELFEVRGSRMDVDC
jgi:hypothetical protein